MNEKWDAAIHAVLTKAATDAEFRAKCLSHPAEAIRQAGGLEMPADAKVRFVEQLDDLVIPLPPLDAKPDEIADDALDQIAGGKIKQLGWKPAEVYIP